MDLGQLYPWTKSLHLLSVFAWMAGMFYLPRLYVYHSDAAPGSEVSETFKVMERRLFRYIMRPAMVASYLFGVWLIIAGIYRIAFAIRVRKVIDGEWWMILGGVLGILLGAMFVAEPMVGVVSTSLWIGIIALAYGLFQIFASFRIKKLAKP